MISVLLILAATATGGDTLSGQQLSSGGGGFTEAAADLLYQQLGANNTIAAQDLYTTSQNGTCYEDADQCITSDGAGGYELQDEGGTIIWSITTAGLVLQTGILQVPDGAVGAPSVGGVGGNSNTGFFYSAADQISYAGDGVERVRFASSGRVSNQASTGNIDMLFVSPSSSLPAYSFAGDTDTGFHRGGANEVDLVALAATRLFIVGSATGANAALQQGAVAMGTNTAKLGGIIETNATAVGNVGAGTDDLMTFSLAASTLSIDLQTVSFRAWGTFAATVNNKTLTAAFGSTTLITSGAIAANTGDWQLSGTCMRTGAATQDCVATLFTSNALLPSTVDFTSPTETLSGAVTLKLTGTATANDDIVQEGWVVRWDSNN